MNFISSKENPQIKYLKSLYQKSKTRKQDKLFVIEGWKEIQMALQNQFVVIEYYFRNGEDITNYSIHSDNSISFIDASLFDDLTYRGKTAPIIAIAKQKEHVIELNKKLKSNGLFIVLDDVEKPGNLGAILRTADATNVDAVFFCNPNFDIYNPNTIRSSVGCFFSVPLILATKEEILHYLQAQAVKIYTTSLKAAVNYTTVSYKTAASAFVFGTEATGVNEFWENQSNQNIILPMLGQNDSLNVSNTVAIVLYEAIRQRNITP